MAEAQGQAAAPAASLESLIAGQIDAEGKPPEKEAPAKSAAEANDGAGTDAATEGEDAPPATDADADEEAEQVETTEIPLETLESIPLEVTVKGEDGKDIVKKLTVKELKSGYMMEADYRHKTADLSRQRDQIGQERQGFQGERAQYQKNLTELQSLVMATAASELQGVNWNELAVNNPAEYIRLQNRRDQISQVLQGIRAQQTEATTKEENTKRQVKTQTAHETVSKLKTEVPGWNDDIYEKVLANAAANGVPRGVANEWIDHGVIKLAHKAMLYDQLQAGKPVADKKVINVPKVIKPGAVTESSGKQNSGKAALKRLASSGKVTDLADVIASQM